MEIYISLPRKGRREDFKEVVSDAMMAIQEKMVLGHYASALPVIKGLTNLIGSTTAPTVVRS